MCLCLEYNVFKKGLCIRSKVPLRDASSKLLNCKVKVKSG